MNKTLVFVDAENVSEENFVQVVADLKSSGECVRGKFYGSREHIGCLIDIGYQAGYEFIDTTSLIKGKKNVTDMKIVVDCITEVMESQDVTKVVIVSNDCDFIPLAYKLCGLGIVVEMPLRSNDSQDKTLADLEQELHKMQYDPRIRQDILYPQYQVVRSMLSEEFSDQLITEWITRKKRKFLKDVALLFNTQQLEDLDMPVTEFCFVTICNMLQIKYETDIGKRLLDSFTQRCFGFRYPENVAQIKLRSICEKGDA